MDKERESKKDSSRTRGVRGCDGCGRLLADCACDFSEPTETPWSRGDDEDLSYD